MAKTQQKDILTRFQDLGNEAMHKLADFPGGNRLVEVANETKTRLDEMQKKLRGLDELEKRVVKLEKHLGIESKQGPARAPKPSAARKPAPSDPKRATTPKPPA